jgi:hypothetical protein
MSFKKIGMVAGSAVAAVGFALAAAGPAAADSNSPWIGSGYSTNTHAVWCVQHDINYRLKNDFPDGPPIPLLAEDGQWGTQTYNGVRWYQTYMLGAQYADGVVGPKTGTDLFLYGDPYYNGAYPFFGYCYQYLPL